MIESSAVTDIYTELSPVQEELATVVANCTYYVAIGEVDSLQLCTRTIKRQLLWSSYIRIYHPKSLHPVYDTL